MSFSAASRSYSLNSTVIETDRDREYNIFAKVTNDLKKSADELDETKKINALHRNKELWLILATDISSSGNSLPAELKANIFYLYEFTIKHTQEILQKKENADINNLIEINRNIMRGLRGIEAQK